MIARSKTTNRTASICGLVGPTVTLRFGPGRYRVYTAEQFNRLYTIL